MVMFWYNVKHYSNGRLTVAALAEHLLIQLTENWITPSQAKAARRVAEQLVRGQEVGYEYSFSLLVEAHGRKWVRLAIEQRAAHNGSILGTFSYVIDRQGKVIQEDLQ